MTHSPKAAVALLAVLILAAGVSWAQPAPAPTPDHPFCLHAISCIARWTMQAVNSRTLDHAR